MPRGRPVGAITGPHPNRLREVRQRFQFELKDVAKALGVTSTHAGRIERGFSPLTDEQIAKLRTIMPVGPGEFLVDDRARREATLVDMFRRLGDDDQDKLIRLGVSVFEPAAPYIAETPKKKGSR